jgi:TonB dependent receptor
LYKYLLMKPFSLAKLFTFWVVVACTTTTFAQNDAPKKGETDSIPTPESEISVITLQSDEDGGDGTNDGSTFVSALLESRDPFLQAATFSFSAARFRLRGLNNSYTGTYLNGIPMNDLEDDQTDFRDWRGLNDVLRARQQSYGLSMNETSFGMLGGITNIDLRAGSQRKQTRLNYGITNRSYRNRIMLTHNSGELNGGWAYSFSVSHSWAQAGFIPGTFVDGSAYFASIDKRINRKNVLNLVVLGSPSTRGAAATSVKLMTELADNKYYNPLWGFQNGEVRNSRVDKSHQPIIMLRHDFTPNHKLTLTTAGSYQFGRSGRSYLDWNNGKNPMPDYYLRLPYTIEDPVSADAVTEELSTNEASRQIDWDNLYFINRHSAESIENANGQAGNTVTGNRSQYIVGEWRNDSRETNLYTNVRYQLNAKNAIHGGLSYQGFKGLNFQTVNDLLGGDYWVNINRFAVRDFGLTSEAAQFDLNMPNRIVKESERYGYDYESHVRKAASWAQLAHTGRRVDYFLAGQLANTTFWRFGNTKSGLFPVDSEGESAHHSFLQGGGKVGMTYKVTGRHFVYARGMYQTVAPHFRDAFISPRTRNEVAPNLRNSTQLGGEIGYQLRSPKINGRLTAYYNQIDKETVNTVFFHDDFQAFVNYNMTDVSRLNRGLEGAINWNINAAFTLRLAGNYGRHIYNNRPTATITRDNTAEGFETRTVYIKNYYLPNSPQQAYHINLGYKKNFWFVNLSANYFADNWININPDRRTVAGISYDTYGVDRVLAGSDLWNSILDQEKLPNFYTVDFFGGRSFKLPNDHMLYLNVGVNNLLNNQYILAGYEQLRFDYEEKNLGRFPNKYQYGQGTNFFISLAYRFIDLKK